MGRPKKAEDNLFVFSMRMEKSIYEKMIKLKIVRGDTGSFNRWVNKMLADVVNRYEGEIRGYKVDNENSDF